MRKITFVPALIGALMVSSTAFAAGPDKAPCDTKAKPGQPHACVEQTHKAAPKTAEKPGTKAPTPDVKQKPSTKPAPKPQPKP